MKKNEIIFFDQLGFGWVVDEHTLPRIFIEGNKHQRVSESGLFERVHQGKGSQAK